MVSVPRTRPPYPEEFRREAVALVRREGRSIRDVAESLGVSQQSLRAWLKRTQLDAGERQDGLRSDQREELRRLPKPTVLDLEPSSRGRPRPVSTYRFISAERASFPVSLLCAVLEVSKSGFIGPRPNYALTAACSPEVKLAASPARSFSKKRS
jgi:transposase-like protein